MTSGSTYHVLIDGSENPDLDRLIRHLKVIQPRWINVTGCSRYKEGLQFIERVYNEVPYCRAIWRGWDSDEWRDGGLWQRKTPLEWYQHRVLPHAALLRRLNIVVMTDNEAIVDDMTPYGDWMAKAIEFAAADNVQVAVGRSSTGTPRETPHPGATKNNYQQLEAMYRALSIFGGVLSPNEYFERSPQLSAGHLFRYQNYWKAMQALGLKPPPTVIGEYGLAYQYDPGRGYGAAGIGGAQHARIGIENYRQWYQPYGVDVAWFVWGAWGNRGTYSLHRDEAFIGTIEDAAKAGLLTPIKAESYPPPVVQPPPVIVTPPTPPPTPVPVPAPTPAPSIPAQAEIDLRRIIELNDQIDAAYAEIASIVEKYRPLLKTA